MQYDEVVAAVRKNSDLNDNEHATTAVVGTLELLGQRLAGREPADLASQLPAELQDALSRRTGSAETFDVDEFLRRLAQYEGRGVTPEQARDHAQAVLGTLSSFVSGGEIDDVRSQLPAGYAPLFA